LVAGKSNRATARSLDPGGALTDPYEMRIVRCLAALLCACGAVASPLASPTPAATSTAPAALMRAPLEACGTVTAWMPPTVTGFVVKTGTDMCLFGGLDGQTAQYHGATVIDSPFCGAVLALTPAAKAVGSITLLHFAAVTLGIPPGMDLGTPRLGMRRCVSVGVSPAGDAVVRGRATPSLLDMDLDLGCGAVKSYATGSAIAIGSRRWEMAAGTAYDTAGPNGADRTTAGTPMCLAAALDDQGRITRYLTNEMPPQEGGTVTTYLPPTASAPGTLVFSYRHVRAVAVGAALEGVVVGTSACVTLGLDPAGDRVVTGSVACGGVGF